MDPQTKIVWDFSETAFRTGALDKILDLANVLTEKKPEDFSRDMANLEDVFIEMLDTAPMEKGFGRVYEVMEALTDDDVLEGLGILLSIVTPVLRKVAEQADGDPFTLEKQAEVKEKGRKVLSLFKAIGSIAAQNIKASLEGRSARQLGHDIGRFMNSTSAWVNGIHEKDRRFFADLMSGIFRAVDGKAYLKMNLVLADAFMEQKPPMFQLAKAMMMKGIRKRLRRKK
jgi:hypothetical protein